MDLRLETPRLVLRPLALGDVGVVRSLLIHPDVRRWMCDGRVLPEAAVRSAVLESLAGFRLALIARLGFRPLVNTPGAFGAIRWFALERHMSSNP